MSKFYKMFRDKENNHFICIVDDLYFNLKTYEIKIYKFDKIFYHTIIKLVGKYKIKKDLLIDKIRLLSNEVLKKSKELKLYYFYVCCLIINKRASVDNLLQQYVSLYIIKNKILKEVSKENENYNIK